MNDTSKHPQDQARSAHPFTAAQIENGVLEPLGQRIAAHLQKMRAYEAKAEVKAGVELRKADDNFNSACRLIAEAKPQCDRGGFGAFQQKYAPDIGRSRLYQLLAIGRGETTIEEVRAATRERTAKSRTKVSATNPPVADSLAVKEVEQLVAVPAVVTDEPSVTETPEASAERRKAEYADPPQINGKIETVTELEAEPETIEDAEAEVKRLKALKAEIKANGGDNEIDPEESAKALAEFKIACATWLPKLNSDHLQGAIDHFAEAVEVPAKELMPDLRELQIDVKIAKAEVTALKRKLAGKLPPREGRAAAWSRLAGEAVENIEQLIEYQSEFESAKEQQPDNLQNGPFAQKCEEICGIDLESALSALQEAEAADLPLGFGRDY